MSYGLLLLRVVVGGTMAADDVNLARRRERLRQAAVA
jgi:hypothetical protein